jgi:hypothetical protein
MLCHTKYIVIAGKRKETTMPDNPIAADEPKFSIRNAARFWEPRRLIYNVALTAIALFWLIKDWSHFRSALSWYFLGVITVLALLANLCYCAAYVADLAIQHLLPNLAWNRSRWAIWSLGTLFAIVFESYWINDEIYPYVSQAASLLLR